MSERARYAHQQVCSCIRLCMSPHCCSVAQLQGEHVMLCCAVLCCAVLCCAVLCCAVPCRAVPCRAVPCCAVSCCACCAVLHVMLSGVYTVAKRCCLLTWICHQMSPLQACWLLRPSPQQWYQQQHGPLGLRSGEPKHFIACQHHLGYHVWSMAPVLSARYSVLLQGLLIWAACRQRHQAFSQPSMQCQLLCCSRS